MSRGRDQAARPSVRAFAAFAAACLVAAAAPADPIPAPIVLGGIAVEVSDLLQMPETATAADPGPRTKINFVREPPDGSGRWFVNDLRGRLYVVENGAISTYADLGDVFPNLKVASFAGGFVTFAFHPDFATPGAPGFGKLYTVHGEDGGVTGATPVIVPPATAPHEVRHQSVLTEWTTADPASSTFSGARREIMRLGQFRNAHPVGDLLFDDGGLLYVAVGDGRSWKDGRGDVPQGTDSFLGSILRIDPLGAGPGEYSVPASNPFVDDGDPDTLGEIFAFGFRNPHRLAFDAETGVLLATDIGEGDVEEVDIVHSGRNYGWGEREGTYTVGGGPLPAGDPSLGYTYPVGQYDHDEGSAIAGGFVYRGAAVPDLDGMFVFGDIVNGRIFYAPLEDLVLADDGDPATTAVLFELELLRGGVPVDMTGLLTEALGFAPNRVDLRFAQTADGEIFLMSKQDGFIRALTAASIPGPDDLVIDFGAPLGIWLWMNDATWRRLNALASGGEIVVADLDANGLDDVVVDFGPSHGLWIYWNGAAWRRLNALTADGPIATGDIDGDGASDLVIDFGEGIGLWAWLDNATWKRLNALASAGPVLLADLDGNGLDEVLVDFGATYGLWVYRNDSVWTQLNAETAAGPVVSGDLDGNGRADIVVDFGASYGIWALLDDGTWKQLNALPSAGPVLAVDLDGNGRDDVVVDFGAAFGLWIYRDDAAWTQLSALPSNGRMAVADLDGSGQVDLIIDFGLTLGLWARLDDATWKQLTTVSIPEDVDIVVADLDRSGQDDIVVDFGPALGLWAYRNGTAWGRLNSESPTGPMTAGDFDGP